MILPSRKALEVNQFLSTSKSTDINIKMHFSANETLTTFLLRDIRRAQPSFFRPKSPLLRGLKWPSMGRISKFFPKIKEGLFLSKSVNCDLR